MTPSQINKIKAFKFTTVRELIILLKRAGKPVARETIHNYLRRGKIKPLGARQRPQRYPADTGEKILVQLGLLKKSNGR